MRKILFASLLLVLLSVTAIATWFLKGRQISLMVDRQGTGVTSSEPVRSIRYEGNGTGGVFYLNQTPLGVNTVVPPLQPPSFGSTKDGKLGVAAGGKVFPLGQLQGENENVTNILTAVPDPGDSARLTLEHSKLSWPTMFDLNFMTGSTPSRKRHFYYRLTWSKSNGAKLEMLWRFEQYYDRANGWTNPMMMREGETGLLKIEITP